MPILKNNRSSGHAEKAWAEARKVIYVEANGAEYPAVIAPLPIGALKATIIDVPHFEHPAEELKRIDGLPINQQSAALAEYSAKMQTPAKALFHNGKVHRLERLPDGTLSKTTEFESKYIPAPDLLIDYGERQGLILKQRVRHADYVSHPPKGRKRTPHFRFDDEPAKV